MIFFIVFQCFSNVLQFPFQNNLKKFNKEEFNKKECNKKECNKKEFKGQASHASFKTYVDFFQNSKEKNVQVLMQVLRIIKAFFPEYLPNFFEKNDIKKNDKKDSLEKAFFTNVLTNSFETFNNLSKGLLSYFQTVNIMNDLFTKKLRALWSPENLKLFLEKIEEFEFLDQILDQEEEQNIKQKAYYKFLLQLYDVMSFFKTVTFTEEEKDYWKALLLLELPTKENYRKCIFFFLKLVNDI
jgi:hypothetical protein